MNTLPLGVCLALAMACGLAAQSPADPAAQTNALRAALAQKIEQLGMCNAELGPLQQLSAQVISGKLQDVTATTARVKAEFEKANPGKTFGADFKIVDAPKKETGEK